MRLTFSSFCDVPPRRDHGCYTASFIGIEKTVPSEDRPRNLGGLALVEVSLAACRALGRSPVDAGRDADRGLFQPHVANAMQLVAEHPLTVMTCESILVVRAWTLSPAAIAAWPAIVATLRHPWSLGIRGESLLLIPQRFRLVPEGDRDPEVFPVGEAGMIEAGFKAAPYGDQFYFRSLLRASPYDAARGQCYELRNTEFDNETTLTIPDSQLDPER